MDTSSKLSSGSQDSVKLQGTAWIAAGLRRESCSSHSCKPYCIAQGAFPATAESARGKMKDLVG